MRVNVDFQPGTQEMCNGASKGGEMSFPELQRITIDPHVMGGKPCIRGVRVTVGAITGLIAGGASFQEILDLYPYLNEEDIKAALSTTARIPCCRLYDDNAPEFKS